MDISQLPGAGDKFSLKNRAGNFSQKFKKATQYGDLKNLGDNREQIIKALAPYERHIKLGGLNRMQRNKVWNSIKNNSKKAGIEISKDDTLEIKKLLNHFDKKNYKRKTETVSKSQIVKDLAKDEVNKKESSVNPYLRDRDEGALAGLGIRASKVKGRSYNDEVVASGGNRYTRFANSRGGASRSFAWGNNKSKENPGINNNLNSLNNFNNLNNSRNPFSRISSLFKK